MLRSIASIGFPTRWMPLSSIWATAVGVFFVRLRAAETFPLIIWSLIMAIKLSSSFDIFLIVRSRSKNTKIAITNNSARGIISGPPFIRMSNRSCFCWAANMATRARLSLICAESIITCRKNKFIRFPVLLLPNLQL